MDRIDLQIELAGVTPTDLSLPRDGESSEIVGKRVQAARDVQAARFKEMGPIRLNAHADGELLDRIAPMTETAKSTLLKSAEALRLSARGYHRVLRLARTIADLGAEATICEEHVAEAVSYRRSPLSR